MDPSSSVPRVRESKRFRSSGRLAPHQVVRGRDVQRFVAKLRKSNFSVSEIQARLRLYKKFNTGEEGCMTPDAEGEIRRILRGSSS